MNSNLKEIELFLKKEVIPNIKEKPLTFLGISKQPHYENVWSNIYAFFLNSSAEHNLEDLFLRSLLQLINKKTNQEFLLTSMLNVETEVYTEKGGRIDLLLSNSNEAIIIENKVYQNLNNNLTDYWSSIRQEKKQGIILSLKEINKTKIEHPNFISITHLELFQSIMENLSSYFSYANEKYLIFLKDFYQNIINITNPMEENIIRFYCKNQQKINQILKIQKEYINYITSEVDKARGDINEELNFYNNRVENLRYYLCPNNRNLMITIISRGLLDERKELLIIIELQNNLLEQKEKIRTINFDEKEQPFLRSDFYNQAGGYWAHFAIQYCELTDEDIVNLNGYISDTLNNSPILTIYRKLKDTLVTNK